MMKRSMKAVIWIVVALGITAVAGAVIVGNFYRDPEVVGDAYEKGLKWDEERAHMRALGWSVQRSKIEIKDKKASVLFSVRDSEGAAVELAPESVKVSATRPAGGSPDLPCSISRAEDASMLALCELGAYGKWDFVVEVQRGVGTERFVLKSYIPIPRNI